MQRQEKIKAEAQMKARLETEKKRAEEALESQRAANHAEEKLFVENSKKATALAIPLKATTQTMRTRTDWAKKEASLGTFLKGAESALKLEEQRSQIYKEVAAETEVLRKNMDLRGHEMLIARRIRQISGTTESVRGKAIEFVTLISNSTNPTIQFSNVCGEEVSQCVTTFGSFNKSVYACAQVVVLVTSQVPKIMNILLAELNKVCIYTVPKCTELENLDTCVERVRSYMRLYGVLVQTGIEGVKNPHRMEEGWAWIARFLNTLSTNLYITVSLLAFLKMTDFALYKTYRSQFKKILDIVSRNFVITLEHQQM